MAFYPIGPCQILVGDPTVTAGAGMTNVGDTEDVSIDLGVKVAYTSNAQRQGAAHADSVYFMTPEPVATAQLKDASITMILLLVGNAVAGTGATGFGDTFTHMYSGGASTLPTVVIVPETQKASGVSAANAIWFPRAVFSGVNGIQFGRVTEGEINQPYNTEIRSAYAATDQNGGAITSGFRMGWMGVPTGAGAGPTTWVLPALS